MVHVLKIGGSLLGYPEKLRLLCNSLIDISKDFNLLIVPGGGVFAQTVREMYTKFSIPEDIAHKMAVLAMNQYGLFLQSLFGDFSNIVEEINEIDNCFKDKSIAIFQVSKMMNLDNHLPKVWEVTSDSIAAYISQNVGAKNLILIKVIDNLTELGSGKLLSQVNVNMLNSGVKKGDIDDYIKNILEPTKIQCFIVNGRFPDRVNKILRGDKTVSTEIIYD